jgi:hypothetical protein
MTTGRIIPLITAPIRPPRADIAITEEVEQHLADIV